MATNTKVSGSTTSNMARESSLGPTATSTMVSTKRTSDMATESRFLPKATPTKATGSKGNGTGQEPIPGLTETFTTENFVMARKVVLARRSAVLGPFTKESGSKER